MPVAQHGAIDAAGRVGVHHVRGDAICLVLVGLGRNPHEGHDWLHLTEGEVLRRLPAAGDDLRRDALRLELGHLVLDRALLEQVEAASKPTVGRDENEQHVLLG